MKKLTFKVSKVIARLSLSAAFVGAGLASYSGWYQPKVPTRIAK